MSEPQDTHAAPIAHQPTAVVEKPARILGLFPPEMWDKFLQNVIEKHSVIILIALAVYGGYRGIYEPESKKSDARNQRLEASVAANAEQINAIRDTADSVRATAEAQRGIASSMDNTIRTLERLSDRADRRTSPPN